MAAICCIGEVLWDILPSGKRLGGAAVNVACHLAEMGHDAFLVSVVGADHLGAELLAAVGERLPTHYVQQHSELTTGRVDVTLSAEGVPSYDIAQPVAWDALAINAEALEGVRSADAVYFGTLMQRDERSRRSVQAYVSAAGPQAVRVCDVNIREPFISEAVLTRSLELAHVVKISDEELPRVAQLLGATGDHDQCIQTIISRFNLHLLILTMGAEGSLWCRLGQPAHLCAAAVVDHMADTVGAGDSNCAVTIHGLLQQWPDDKTGQLANQVAAYVCGQDGATPRWPQALKSLM